MDLTNRSSRPRLSLLLGPALLLALAACGGGSGEPAAGGGGRPPPGVVVQSFSPGPVEVYEEYAGRARGSREVEVRARVRGILLERLYDEGQFVEEGTPLFRIDPDRYAIELQRAEAELANARAELRQARRDWERVSELHEREVVSESERDAALSARELAEARIGLAEASVARAELDLAYTEVRAPLSGMTGLESFPEGSLIERGDLLTTVTQDDPIRVRFSLPEKDVVLQRKAREALAGEEVAPEPKVRLRLPDGQLYGRTGVIDFTDSSIDPRTGNVVARATFPNPDGVLLPGQFVRIRLRVQTLEDVFLVPEEAISQAGPNPVVFVVADGTATAQPVELGPALAQGQVLLSGITPGDEVVVSGQVALRDGMPVQVLPASNGNGS